MKRVFLVIILSISCLLTGCSFKKDNNSIKTIGAIMSSKNEENDIYVLEDNQYVPFIIVTNNYNGNTLLLRKEILSESRRINNYSSFYENSDIDLYLNNEYKTNLNGIKDLIVNTEIDITDDNAIGFSGTKEKTITRDIFLLSSTEINVDNCRSCGKEGKVLDYFKNTEHRIAYLGNEPVSWWLRTPATDFTSCTMAVGATGKIGMTNSSDLNGIRPAFCIPKSTKIKLSNDIVPGKEVYILSL